jgi:site-specific recombinase XerD
LRTLLRSAGDRPLHQVTPKQISMYLDGSHMSAYTWWREYQIIRSFFQFWQSRNRLARLPMPRPRAALPPPFRPYILSKTELLRLLMAIERTSLLDPMTMRTFLLFLYGTGARVHEAIGLRISDIDLRHSSLCLRQAEGGRKRMLPIGRTLRNTLDLYLQSSAAQRRDADLFFVTSNGGPLRRNTLRYNFVRICARARIHQEHSYSPTPGMHDLRHTFAVHCLETWLRNGQDLRQKLPVLSGYMGHAILKNRPSNICGWFPGDSTSRYRVFKRRPRARPHRLQRHSRPPMPNLKFQPLQINWNKRAALISRPTVGLGRPQGKELLLV